MQTISTVDSVTRPHMLSAVTWPSPGSRQKTKEHQKRVLICDTANCYNKNSNEQNERAAKKN
jgi:hypothetical protein